MPPVRPTKESHALRVEAVIALIARGYRDGRIKRVCADEFKVSPRTVERYLRRAREELLARRQRSKSELQAESLAFYESIIADPKASRADKLRAARRRDQLLGLDEPQRLEHTGAGGGPIKTEHTEVRRQMQKLMSDPRAMELAGELGELMADEQDDEGDA